MMLGGAESTPDCANPGLIPGGGIAIGGLINRGGKSVNSNITSHVSKRYRPIPK